MSTWLHAAAHAAYALGPEDLYNLYRADRLVLHSIPTSSACDRPACLNARSSLMCGTLLFYNPPGGHGQRVRPVGRDDQDDDRADQREEPALRNAVARFGDKERVRQTVFGSLHDMDMVGRVRCRDDHDHLDCVPVHCMGTVHAHETHSVGS